MDDPEYHRRRRDIESYLRMPRAIEKFCTHETGHRIYFKQIGLTTEPVGPTIKYDNGVWDSWCVAVKSPKPSRSQLADQRFLIKFTRGAVAGGVFVEFLLGLPEAQNGDPDDWTLFKTYCKTAQDLSSTHTYNSPTRRWRKARVKVRADLEKGVVDANEICRIRAEIEHGCFPVR
jgi:hypothetical protein